MFEAYTMKEGHKNCIINILAEIYIYQHVHKLLFSLYAYTHTRIFTMKVYRRDKYFSEKSEIKGRKAKMTHKNI